MRLLLSGSGAAGSIANRDLDRWQGRFQLPFRLSLAAKGVIVHTELAGVALSEFETGLEVVNGWFVLRPRRASILGIPSQLASWLRAYLPLPPISPEARLSGIEHAAGSITLHFSISDFEENVSPGMLKRLRKRLLPSPMRDVSGATSPIPTPWLRTALSSNASSLSPLIGTSIHSWPVEASRR